MGKPNEYQGHRSWNAWNVSLYISNDEPLYRAAQAAHKRARSLDHCVTLFCRDTGLLGDKTPDGAVYNRLSIKLAIEGLELGEFNNG